MQTITEPQVDRLLHQLQHVIERSPVHLRPKRRQILRGMRSALAAMADAPTLDGLRDELVYELTGFVPEEPVVIRMGTPSPLPPLHAEVLRLLDAGVRPSVICQRLDCSKHVVAHCRRLQSNGDEPCAIPAQLEEVTQNG